MILVTCTQFTSVYITVTIIFLIIIVIYKYLNQGIPSTSFMIMLFGDKNNQIIILYHFNCIVLYRL